MITTSQLSELTDLINERANEFDGLIMPRMSRGLVRLIYAAVEEWWEREEEMGLEQPSARHGLAFYSNANTSDIIDAANSAPNLTFVHEPERLGVAAPPAPSYEHYESFSEASAMPQPLTDATAATLGPEHVVVTPLRPIGRDRLPDPDAARAKLADALSSASGGALVQAINKPRTLAEVDGLDDDDEPCDGDDCDEDEELDEGASPKPMTDARRAQLNKLKAERAARSRRGSAGVIEPESERRKGRRATVTRAEFDAEIRRQAMAGVIPGRDSFDAAKPATWPTAAAFSQRFGRTWTELAREAGLQPNGDLRVKAA